MRSPTRQGPPGALPGLDPAWSRMVSVPDSAGVNRSWHVLDNGVRDPVVTLLCVHGNPTWSYLWRRLLAAAPAGWRVVAPDQLGMGYSERLEAPRVLAERVADLGTLTKALDLTGPVVTVGHDWGGAISLGWALRHRDEVVSCVLTNTAVAQPEGDRGPMLIRLAHVPAIRRWACVGTPLFVHASTALSRPRLSAAVRRAFAAPYGTAARRRSVGDFVADIPFAVGHPSRPAVEEIAQGVRSLDVPVLLLWGPRDPVFGEKYLADLRSRLPRTALHRYEEASHLLPEDAPEYADAVVRWVRDLRPETGAEPAGHSDESPEAPRNGSARGGERAWTALDRRAQDSSPAVVDVAGSKVGWDLLSRRVREIAAGLAASGVRPGDRVALLVEPSADLTAALYAVWRAGGVVVVADKGLGLLGMRRALRGAAVDHVIGSRAGLAAARVMGLTGSRFGAGPLSRAERRALGARHGLVDLARIGRSAAAPPEPPLDAECAVVFTSGATGPAKGVVYRHAQVLAQRDLVRSTYRLTEEDRVVAAFAPFALLGPALGVGSAVPDMDVTSPGTLSAAALADAVEAIDATIVFAAPAALRSVVRTAPELTARQRSVLGGVRLLMSAGAPVPAALLRAVQEVVPAAELHTPYGMTEVLPVSDITLEEIEGAGPGNGVCVGRPLPGVDVAVSALSTAGSADGPPIAEPECTGEICVRAAHAKERYDALWMTERASSRDVGWHRTGDVGHLDREGRLWVEGRLGHVIATAEGPVTPVGVEQRVEALRQVRSAAVVGVGPTGSQVVVVVVVPRRLSSVGWRSWRGSAPQRPGKGSLRLTLAPDTLGRAVRAAAGVEVAAVLRASSLPLDIRHASKVDRRLVAVRAARLLAGASPRTGGRSTP